MPYENEHACRLMYPGDFSKFRSKNSGKARLILGQRKGSDEWEVQAIRYPKGEWPEDVARRSCEAHEGMFEAAVKVAEHTYGDNGIPEWDEKADGKLPECAVKLLAETPETVKAYARSLSGVEIFSAGTWNGDTYTEEDLDAMVAAFPDAGIVPPLKLGHSEAQKFFGQKDGAPALGWVARIYRAGKKLLADFTDVPESLHGMIREKKYRKVSAEIYWDFKKATGEILPRVLRAVALLGADIPAVTNLQDLQTALLAEEGRLLKAYGDGEPEVHSYETEIQEGDMDEKQYKDRIATLEGDVAKEKARADKAETDLANTREEADVKQFIAKLSELKRAGKIVPAEEEGLVASFRAIPAGVRKYADGKERDARADFVKGLEARQKVVDFKEHAEGGEGEGGGPAVKTVSGEASKIMHEKKISYSEALGVIEREQPELWKAYVTRKEVSK